MAAKTDLDILDRLRAIMAAYTGYTTANDLSVGAALTVLPSFIVAPLDTVWVPETARRFFVTQSFEIIGIVSRVLDETQLDDRLSAYRDALPVARPWVAWLHAHPLLALNDGGMVQNVGAISAGGFGPYTYGKVKYSAFRLQIEVTTYNA